ncbi:MAG: hypothetical protein ABSG35_21870 [Syntrophobacteraceae bacterium]
MRSSPTSMFGPMNADLAIRHDDKAPQPALDILCLEKLYNLAEEGITTGSAKPNQDASMMESGLKTPVVGEIKILCNQKTRFVLSGRP